jgi:hypothetical protein
MIATRFPSRFGFFTTLSGAAVAVSTAGVVSAPSFWRMVSRNEASAELSKLKATKSTRTTVVIRRENAMIYDAGGYNTLAR